MTTVLPGRGRGRGEKITASVTALMLIRSAAVRATAIVAPTADVGLIRDGREIVGCVPQGGEAVAAKPSVRRRRLGLSRTLEELSAANIAVRPTMTGRPDPTGRRV